MVELIVNTSNAEYQQQLRQLGTLRATLVLRLTVLARMSRTNQLRWLIDDPLLRRAILLAQEVGELTALEVTE